MLGVVEHEEEVSWPEHVDEGGQHVTLLFLPYLEEGSDGGGHESGIGAWGEVADVNPIGISPVNRAGQLEGQAGLTDAARSRQGKQAGAGESILEGKEFSPPTEEGG